MINQIKTGVILSYLNIFLGLIISVFYTPFMLGIIGVDNYGLYTLIGSIVGYLGLLNFGFSSSYMRHYAKYASRKQVQLINQLNGMFLLIFCFIASLILVIGFSIFPNLQYVIGDKIIGKSLEVSKILYLILVLNLAIPLLTTTFNVYIIAQEKFIFLKVISLLKTMLNPILMIPILLSGYDVIGIALVTLCITILFEVVISIFAFKVLKINFKFGKFDFNLVSEMFVFSAFIFLNMIIDQINWSVDKLLIGRYNGTTSVAIYGIASQINSYYIMFSTQLSSVFTPRVNKLIASHQSGKISDLFTKVGRIQYLVLSLVLLGFYAFGLEFIILWVGDAYESAYYIVLILIGAVTIPSVQNIGIEVQRAKNMHKFRSVVYFFIAIANVVISIQLVQIYGPIGAALGTGLALIIGNGLIMNWYYHNYLEINMFKFWSSIARMSLGNIIPIVFAIFIKNYFVLDNIYFYITTIILFIVVYLISMWLFGLNNSEKNIILEPLKRQFTSSTSG